MRYRALSVSGDYVFGQGVSEIMENSPDAVAQAVRTRLLLSAGEWFLDSSEGTPYSSEILGMGTQPIYDQAVRERILGTVGVTSIESYSSFLDSQRKLTVSCTINTQFGRIILNQVL